MLIGLKRGDLRCDNIFKASRQVIAGQIPRSRANLLFAIENDASESGNAVADATIRMRTRGEEKFKNPCAQADRRAGKRDGRGFEWRVGDRRFTGRQVPHLPDEDKVETAILRGRTAAVPETADANHRDARRNRCPIEKYRRRKNTSALIILS